MAAAEFVTFLEAVDQPAADAGVVAAAAGWFVAAGIPTAGTLEGITVADLEALAGDKALPDDLVLRAFIRRACAAAAVVATIKRRRIAESQASGSGDLGSAQSSLALVQGQGQASTALALLASAAAASGSGCDIVQRSIDAGMQGWPPHLQAEKSLWDALELATRKAQGEQPARSAFTFVDLTGRETLPVWLPQAVLTTGRPTDPALLGISTPPDQLKQLMAALCAATSAPRAFTSLGQWHAAWRRYAPVAVATKQLSWVAKAQHEEVVDRLYEDERAAGRNPLVSLIYDEVARQEWARRAAMRDPTFDMEVLTLKRDDLLLEAARSRLASSTTARASTPGLGAGSAESAVAKQEEAAAAFARRANDASKQLAKSQEQLARQQQQAAASAAAAVAAHPSTGDGGARLSRKERKGKDKGHGKGSKDKRGKGTKGPWEWS